MAQALRARGPVTGTAATPKKRSKLFVLDLYRTAVGKKYVMAITGIMLVGFVIMHMVGNLKVSWNAAICLLCEDQQLAGSGGLRGWDP